MDGSLAPQPQKEKKGLAFLEIRIFEIFFVAIILAIFPYATENSRGKDVIPLFFGSVT